MRTTSCIIFSFASAILPADAPSLAIFRNFKPSSRNFVVSKRSITLLFCAFQLSGYSVCGTMPYLLTRLTIISHCPPSPTGEAMSALTSRESTSSSCVSTMDSRK